MINSTLMFPLNFLRQSEAANQLKRGGKGGAGSLGAADAADDGYERPIATQLAIPSTSSLKSSSSSAQDLQQVWAGENELQGGNLSREGKIVGTGRGLEPAIFI